MTLLLDSSILIDGLRQSALAIGFVRGLSARPHLSVVSISELRAGQRGDREGKQIDAILTNSVLLDVDRAIAELSGQLMQRFQKSHALATPDALIAATAIHHGLQLVTLNLKHFPMFSDLERPY